MSKMSKTEKLVSALATGKEFTSAKLAAKTGLENVSSAIHRLRNEGFQIFLNSKKTPKGVQNYYRLAS
jgi:biotin operon repressor